MLKNIRPNYNKQSIEQNVFVVGQQRRLPEIVRFAESNLVITLEPWSTSARNRDLVWHWYVMFLSLFLFAFQSLPVYFTNRSDAMGMLDIGLML